MEITNGNAASVKVTQKPSVGRIVHYWVADSYGNIVPRAAIITHVWGDNCVNLHVFGDGSFGADDSKQTSVIRTDGPDTLCWSWPERTINPNCP